MFNDEMVFHLRSCDLSHRSNSSLCCGKHHLENVNLDVIVSRETLAKILASSHIDDPEILRTNVNIKICCMNEFVLHEI